MLGWPYVTPGTSNAKGIDCSGAFVYAYRQFGERIYHGSNRIARIYCREMKRVTASTRLEPGMAIFKSRSDLSRMKGEYKPGGAYYDPNLTEDFYHIGLVVSASRRPLTRSSPMAALPVYSTGLLPVRGIRPASAPGTEKASSSMFPRAKTV